MTMSTLQDIPWNANGQLETLFFDLRDKGFALEATLVHEILDPIIETRVPGSAPLVGAIINFRGRVIPLTDMGLAFSMPPWRATQDSRIIVIACPMPYQTILLGIKADRVHEVMTISRTQTEPAPEIGRQWNPDYIRGLIKTPDGLIAIPNLKHIFSAPENRQQTCVSRLSTN